MVSHKSVQNPNLGQLHKSQDESDGIGILLRSLFFERRVKITIYVVDTAAIVQLSVTSESCWQHPIFEAPCSLPLYAAMGNEQAHVQMQQRFG